MSRDVHEILNEYRAALSSLREVEQVHPAASVAELPPQQRSIFERLRALEHEIFTADDHEDATRARRYD